MKALGENIGSGLFLLAVLSTLAAAIAVVLTPFISGWLSIKGTQATQLEWAYIGAIVTLWLRLLCMGFIAIEQGYQRPLGVGVINLVTGVIHLVVTVAFLFMGWGLLAIPLGLVVREVLCFTSLALHLARHQPSNGSSLAGKPRGRSGSDWAKRMDFFYVPQRRDRQRHNPFVGRVNPWYENCCNPHRIESRMGNFDRCCCCDLTLELAARSRSS